MALNITKDLSVRGITIPEVYVRLIVRVNGEGDQVRVQSLCYASKLAFQTNPNGGFQLPEIPRYSHFVYNRETDGTDAVGFAHSKLTETLVAGDFVVGDIVSDLDVV